MKVNLVTQNYYPNYNRNNIGFGQAKRREQTKLSRSVSPDVGEAIKEINHEYDLKNLYLAEIAKDIKMPKAVFVAQQHKLQAHRDFMIAELTGDDYDGEEAEEFLEKLTY